jgi:hypothetical protein
VLLKAVWRREIGDGPPVVSASATPASTAAPAAAAGGGGFWGRLGSVVGSVVSLGAAAATAAATARPAAPVATPEAPPTAMWTVPELDEESIMFTHTQTVTTFHTTEVYCYTLLSSEVKHVTLFEEGKHLLAIMDLLYCTVDEIFYRMEVCAYLPIGNAFPSGNGAGEGEN